MSRLYPGWGSGAKKGFFERRLRVVPFKNVNKHLNFGDKLILPQSILKEITKLKLGLPILLMIQKVKALKPKSITKASIKGGIICGVQEFSSSEGIAQVPLAILRRLTRKEDKQLFISIKSLTSTERDSIPKAISCRLQPLKAEFLSSLLNNEVNIVNFMEHALKQYSCLRLNQTFLVSFLDIVFKIKVVALEPDTQVSLLGDLNVLLDFVTPQDQGDVGRIRPKKADNQQTMADEVKVRSFNHKGNEIKQYEKFAGQGQSISSVGTSDETEKENQSKNKATSILSAEDLRQKRLQFLDNLIHQVS